MKRQLLTIIATLICAVVGAAGQPAKPQEQAVIVHFLYGSRDWKPFFSFEEKLENAIHASGVGEYDGNELAADGSDGFLYMYAPDAERLFKLVRPYLEGNALLKNVVVTIRYGAADDPKVKERVVKLGT